MFIVRACHSQSILIQCLRRGELFAKKRFADLDYERFETFIPAVLNEKTLSIERSCLIMQLIKEVKS